MDLGTIIGILGGFSLIIGSIMYGGDLIAFFNPAGLMIVLGGTLMATLIMQKMSVVKGAFQIAASAFKDKSESPEDTVKKIISMSIKAKKGGVLALENEKIANKTLKRGIGMIVDGLEHKEILRTLDIEISSLRRRHEEGHKVFKFMGATSPSMGMIGTLIGLVQMLMTLSDPAAIGPAMAVALLTTFYGAVLAFLVFIPIAEKLEIKTEDEVFILEIVRAGVDGIKRGLNRASMQEKLTGYLKPGTKAGKKKKKAASVKK